MKNRLCSGLLCIAAGFLLIAIPSCILPVCAAVAPPFMKCFWTARAELGLGGALILLGLMLAASRNPAIRLGLSLGGVCLAAVAAAVPVFLIGVCPGDTMPCHMGTLPGLILTAGILLLGLILNIAWLLKILKRR